VDLQWILDRLFDTGKTLAGHNAQITSLESDVRELKKLPERLTEIEGRLDASDKADADERDAQRLDEQIAPARHQSRVSTIAIIIAALSLLTTIALALLHI
jgi:phage shock protein A